MSPPFLSAASIVFSRRYLSARAWWFEVWRTPVVNQVRNNRRLTRLVAVTHGVVIAQLFQRLSERLFFLFKKERGLIVLLALLPNLPWRIWGCHRNDVTSTAASLPTEITFATTRYKLTCRGLPTATAFQKLGIAIPLQCLYIFRKRLSQCFMSLQLL